LLDDGIENNSDLIGADFSRQPPEAQDPQASEIRDATIAKIRADEFIAINQFRRKSISYFGVFLGLVLAISGIALIASPTDMRVEHARMKYLPTVTEHVTPVRSWLYGSALLAVGIALLAYSLKRPRPAGGRA
jgi:hypothetical protein